MPLLTLGYGRSESRDGSVFTWNFPAIGTYWTAADVAVQHIAKELGGFDKLKGKKISLVYHDSPYGKEPIVALESRAKINGFTFKSIPVTHPGVEQKSQWLAIRQDRPDYVLLWGWGVMNSTAIKEAAGVGYPAEFELAALALMLGGNIRVGLEDNFYLPSGEMAKSNG